MIYESARLFVTKNGHRQATVEFHEGFPKTGYYVNFWYDGMPDYEWKRGSNGTNIAICETYAQAKRKALYYTNKENN